MLTLPAVPKSDTAVLSLLDVLGRAVRTETVALLTAGLHHELHLVGLFPDLYALQVSASAVTATHWLVVEKRGLLNKRGFYFPVLSQAIGGRYDLRMFEVV